MGANSLRECPVPEPHQVIDLPLPPTVVLDRERIDAGIDANVADEEIGALYQVCDLIRASLAEAAFRSRH
jgi:hypothetical protein